MYLQAALPAVNGLFVFSPLAEISSRIVEVSHPNPEIPPTIPAEGELWQFGTLAVLWREIVMGRVFRADQPDILSMSTIKGRNSAMTILPTITARNTIMIGSRREVMAATALSTSSS